MVGFAEAEKQIENWTRFEEMEREAAREGEAPGKAG